MIAHQEKIKGFYQVYRETDGNISPNFFEIHNFDVSMDNFPDSVPCIGDMLRKLNVDLSDEDKRVYIHTFCNLLLKGTGFEEYKEMFGRYPTELGIVDKIPTEVNVDYAMLTLLIINTEEYSLRHCDTYFVYGSMWDDEFETYFLGTNEPNTYGFSPGLIHIHKYRTREQVQNMIQDSLDYIREICDEDSENTEGWYEKYSEIFNGKVRTYIDI